MEHFCLCYLRLDSILKEREGVNACKWGRETTRVNLPPAQNSHSLYNYTICICVYFTTCTDSNKLINISPRNSFRSRHDRTESLDFKCIFAAWMSENRRIVMAGSERSVEFNESIRSITLAKLAELPFARI